MRDEAGQNAWAAEARAYRRIDSIVTAAGVATAARSRAPDPDEEWQRVQDIEA
ncbi:MAG: hypothetical protein R3E53_03570 [Myxococcota bacterium]